MAFKATHAVEDGVEPRLLPFGLEQVFQQGCQPAVHPKARLIGREGAANEARFQEVEARLKDRKQTPFEKCPATRGPTAILNANEFVVQIAEAFRTSRIAIDGNHPPVEFRPTRLMIVPTFGRAPPAFGPVLIDTPVLQARCQVGIERHVSSKGPKAAGSLQQVRDQILSDVFPRLRRDMTRKLKAVDTSNQLALPARFAAHERLDDPGIILM